MNPIDRYTHKLITQAAVHAGLIRFIAFDEQEDTEIESELLSIQQFIDKLQNLPLNPRYHECWFIGIPQEIYQADLEILKSLQKMIYMEEFPAFFWSRNGERL